MDIVEIDQPTPTETIARDGDVILIAGPQKKMLRVHSQCLCAASSVFDTWLRPRWRKGEMSSEDPLGVELSKDDADAIRLVCLVVHHRYDEIPENLTPEELLQVAIVVEKYLLTTAFRYVRARWFKTQNNFDDILVGNGYMLAAAYLLGDAEAFAAHSHALVLNINAPFHYLMKEMPLKKFLPLEMNWLSCEQHYEVELPRFWPTER
ncbi:hypothetical protein NM208_g1585 [Fusarium decemcellulare]|uniref:Uncharacterized protein n=1 Tax=Fusarium decemcellulare TaxID=57161 RepID=A0ACC1SW67_9HYPO|nr:hypothetical protein NM208_g1585 [Fusarium decemcellulare]